MDPSQQANRDARTALDHWRAAISENIYESDPDFQHTVQYYFADAATSLTEDLARFGQCVVDEAEALVAENNLRGNLPRLEAYDGLGERTDQIVHHPTYAALGDLLYGTRLLARMAKPGGIQEGLLFLYLTSQLGEAGHNCPIACSAGLVRVLQRVDTCPQAAAYLEKLLKPSFTENYTAAQFLTEIQGGCDVGKNAARAIQDEQGQWRIYGEKWFCSNANADLMLLTARYDEAIEGTKGLGLFLIPAILDSGEHNGYRLRRLKEKLGTQSMASAEIDFEGAFAYAMGPVEQGFKLVMEDVLHVSRLMNTVCVLGMAHRAYEIAYQYAKHREAFGAPVLQYPLVQENLARIKAENQVILSSIWATLKRQDQWDLAEVKSPEEKLLLRLLANLNKSVSALWSVEHIHHCIDVLAGNGAIESFSPLPRFLRDAIVCENWEGTHNVLRMQFLRDLDRYQLDQLYMADMTAGLSDLSDSDEVTWLKQELGRLGDALAALKQQSLVLQSVNCRGVVEGMTILFGARYLLLEALDQKQTMERSTKLACFHYVQRWYATRVLLNGCEDSDLEMFARVI